MAGGKERQDSVWNGLEALSPGTEIVAIQDAARPCTSPALIAATVAAAREMGAAVAAQPVTDTIKESRDGKLIERTLDRSRLWAVQTPQTFRVDIIRRALAAVRQKGLLVTDDTAACELIGQPVQLVLSTAAEPQGHPPGGLALRRGGPPGPGGLGDDGEAKQGAQIRNPKPENRRKAEIRTPNPQPCIVEHGVRVSDSVSALRASGFGFRVYGSPSTGPSTPSRRLSPGAPLQTRLPAIIVWQNDFSSIMKRRLIYGVVVTVAER